MESALLKLFEGNVGAGIIFGLILVLYKLIERRADAKRNGHFESVDREHLHRMHDSIDLVAETLGEDLKTRNEIARRTELALQAMTLALQQVMKNDEDKFRLLRRIYERDLRPRVRGDGDDA